MVARMRDDGGAAGAVDEGGDGVGPGSGAGVGPERGDEARRRYATGWSGTLDEEQRKRLKQAFGRIEYSKLQVADLLGRAAHDISKFLNGTKPIYAGELAFLAELAGVSYLWLLNLSDDEQRDERQASEVQLARRGGRGGETEPGGASILAPRTRLLEPRAFRVRYRVFARANAGPGGGHVLEHERVMLDEEEIDGRRLKFVIVSGDCMWPDVGDGDYAMLDAADVPRAGKIVCVSVLATDEVLLKRWCTEPDDEEGHQRVRLVPNRHVPGLYDDLVLRLDEIKVEGVFVKPFRVAEDVESTPHLQATDHNGEVAGEPGES